VPDVSGSKTLTLPGRVSRARFGSGAASLKRHTSSTQNGVVKPGSIPSPMFEELLRSWVVNPCAVGATVLPSSAWKVERPAAVAEVKGSGPETFVTVHDTPPSRLK